MAEEQIRTELFGEVNAENYRSTFAPERRSLSAGADLPAGWEGLYFPFSSPFARLRPDGTPGDDLLPDIDLPRRMYAGEDTTFYARLHVGDLVEQSASLGRVTEKTGASGRLVFADIVRRYSVGGRPAVESTWHDVFLGESSAPRRTLEHGPVVGEWSEELTLDSRQLFRFSALTFNTHRVHYDKDWAISTEGLPGLLVHGPLTRMLLLDAVTARRDDALPSSFSFTASAPLYVDEKVVIVGHDPDDSTTVVVAVDHNGNVAAKGTAMWG
ncbi:hypothetical protein [Brevibacterium sp. FME17]|uniref:hypothetical protein n=1 Tax=Brevibacterium sp. FME17 TaxID=2742606 RepID=UPI0018682CC3|nr:hypothetical protein [Brevibacterium sp. FME17]